ncbi:MAG: DUF2249 domain-containing protein [Streptosporangiaceae bacterium]
MTDTEAQAYQAMLAHHQALEEGLTARSGAVTGAAEAGQPHGTAVADLIVYLAEQVLPHAAAEEATIYRAAAAHPDLTEMIGGMIAEHVILASGTARLAAAASGTAAASESRQIAGLFAAHVAKENETLLPVLLADDSVDLAGLLADMHVTATQAKVPDQVTGPGGGGRHDDPQAGLLALLLQGATALAHAGEADRACRIAASAWAVLHEARPDLAVRVTAALHGLVRAGEGAGGDPAVDGPAGARAGTSGAAADDGHAGSAAEHPSLSAPGGPDLDVRELAPALRHQTIFDTYRALRPGTGFVLVNDHDPKPLRYQFEAEHAGQFSWSYLESGPRVWRVRIGRAGA